MNIHRNLLCALLVVAGAACVDTETKNVPPNAVVEATIDGEPLNTAMPIAYEGEPIEIVLSGSKSSDSDGTIVKYEWLRTDVSGDVRNGRGDGGAPFEGDPGNGKTATVVLGEGSYRFTLYVTDDDGAIGVPVSVSFRIETLVEYEGDPACVAAYEGPSPECEACVCAPADMNGCGDLWDTCMNNSDATFSELCKAVYDCGISKGCRGSACYAAPLCMAEIDAASQYMGGDLGKCSDAATMPAGNPCRAISVLSSCINDLMIMNVERETCGELCGG